MDSFTGKLTVNLKHLSDTRRLTEAYAVKALRNQLPLIIELLEEIYDGRTQVRGHSITKAQL